MKSCSQSLFRFLPGLLDSTTWRSIQATTGFQAGFFLLSFLALFLNGYFNILSLSPHFWFQNFDEASECFVLGGLCRSSYLKSGDAPNLGQVLTNETHTGTEAVKLQATLISADQSGSSYFYEPYLSQYGLQRIILQPWHDFLKAFQSYLGSKSVTGLAGFNGNISSKLERNFVLILKLPVVILSALTLSLLALWFLREFGPPTASAVLCTFLLGGWITVYSSHLYWMLFSFFLPMVVIAWTSHFAFNAPKPSIPFLAASAIAYFLSITLKCLMGYEFLSTICISATVPLVYYGVSRGLSFRRVLLLLTVLFLLSVGGFVAALYFHVQQITPDLTQGKTLGFLQSIVFKNTYDFGAIPGQIPAVRMEAIHSNPLLVIALYILLPFNKEAFFIPAFCFLLPGVYRCVRILRTVPDSKTGGLAVAALYSIAAPLSWILLAKAHSATHFHYNFIVWFVPTHLMMIAAISMRIPKPRSTSPDS